jgi:hypothetical protein
MPVGRLGENFAISLLTITVPAVLLGAALRRELATVYQSLGAGDAQNGGFIARLLQLIEKARRWLGQYVDLSQIDLRAELIDHLQQLSAFLPSQAAGAASRIN